ncbi:MAG: hypothetical protein JWO63_2515 [Frankiales bacterium]|jgi:hypothetical protein|nr:hypothetical protein [Frankiales bacterium]
MPDSQADPASTPADEPVMAPTNTTGLDPVEAAETNVDPEALAEAEDS